MALRLTLILDLLLKEDIEGCGCLERVAQILGNDDIHDVDTLDVDTVLVEALVKVIHESGGQLALDVSDFADFNHSNEVSDGFLALLLEKLLKLVGS